MNYQVDTRTVCSTHIKDVLDYSWAGRIIVEDAVLSWNKILKMVKDLCLSKAVGKAFHYSNTVIFKVIITRFDVHPNDSLFAEATLEIIKDSKGYALKNHIVLDPGNLLGIDS